MHLLLLLLLDSLHISTQQLQYSSSVVYSLLYIWPGIGFVCSYLVVNDEFCFFLNLPQDIYRDTFLMLIRIFWYTEFAFSVILFQFFSIMVVLNFNRFCKAWNLLLRSSLNPLSFLSSQMKTVSNIFSASYPIFLCILTVTRWWCEGISAPLFVLISSICLLIFLQMWSI